MAYYTDKAFSSQFLANSQGLDEMIVRKEESETQSNHEYRSHLLSPRPISSSRPTESALSFPSSTIRSSRHNSSSMQSKSESNTNKASQNYGEPLNKHITEVPQPGFRRSVESPNFPQSSRFSSRLSYTESESGIGSEKNGNYELFKSKHRSNETINSYTKTRRMREAENKGSGIPINSYHYLSVGNHSPKYDRSTFRNTSTASMSAHKPLSFSQSSGYGQDDYSTLLIKARPECSTSDNQLPVEIVAARGRGVYSPVNPQKKEEPTHINRPSKLPESEYHSDRNFSNHFLNNNPKLEEMLMRREK